MSESQTTTTPAGTDRLAELKARAEASRQAQANARRDAAEAKEREAAAERRLAEVASAAGFDGSKAAARATVTAKLTQFAGLFAKLSEISRERAGVPRGDTALEAEFDKEYDLVDNQIDALVTELGSGFLSDLANIRTMDALMRNPEERVYEEQVAAQFAAQVEAGRQVEISLEEATARNTRIAEARKSGTRLSPQDAREAHKVNGRAFLPRWIDKTSENAQEIAQIRIIARELDRLCDRFWQVRDAAKKAVGDAIRNLDAQSHGTLEGTGACLVRLGEFTKKSPWYHDLRKRDRFTIGPVWFERTAGAKAGKLLGATDGMKKTVEVVTGGNLVSIERGRIQAFGASGKRAELKDWEFKRLVAFIGQLRGDAKPVTETATPSETRRAHTDADPVGPTAMAIALGKAQAETDGEEETSRRKSGKEKQGKRYGYAGDQLVVRDGKNGDK